MAKSYCKCLSNSSSSTDKNPNLAILCPYFLFILSYYNMNIEEKRYRLRLIKR
ncbi:hypothetical protein LEQ41_10425 [Streptococcus agalactiae]|nr:hypothetical protein [Streptococcus agalactiae]